MILNADGKQVEKRYTSDGTSIRTVYNADGDVVFEEIDTAEGTLPQTFKSRGKPLVNYKIYGNAVQNGTPTPSDPVEVQGCGVRTENGYKLDITATNTLENTSVTTPVYIGQSPLYKIGDYADYVDYKHGGIMRYVKELVLTGDERWQTLWGVLSLSNQISANTTPRIRTLICDRYVAKNNLVVGSGYPASYGNNSLTFRDYFSTILIRDDAFGTDTTSFKAYLASQYAAGTPVKIYYVLETPEFEPVSDLAKIPTFAPQTVLDADMTIKPNKIWYKYDNFEVSVKYEYTFIFAYVKIHWKDTLKM